MSETIERAKQLAKTFHETYERLAPEFGYATRKETAVPWDEIPEGNSNKQLMIAVCQELLKASVVQPALLDAAATDKTASELMAVLRIIENQRRTNKRGADDQLDTVVNLVANRIHELRAATK